MIVAPSDLDTVCAGGPGSLTLTVTFSGPARVGTPEMTPDPRVQHEPAGQHAGADRPPIPPRAADRGERRVVGRTDPIPRQRTV